MEASMKSFTELFVAARRVSTPLVAVKTADITSSITAIRKALDPATPFLTWDCITGVSGLNDTGTDELGRLLQEAGIEQGGTAEFAVALGLMRHLNPKESDVVTFMHNVQLQLVEQNADKIQSVLNLRDRLKVNGATVVMFMGVGDLLPVELQQDVLVLEVPLPTRDELESIVNETAKSAKATLKPDAVKQAVDAGVGLPAFPYEQSVAMSMDRAKGVLDIDTLWQRKRDIVSANKGLTYHVGSETLADMYGCDSVQKFGKRFMEGEYSPTLVIRMDEVEKQFAGSSSDSSGTKGNLLGEWLTWVNDRRVICSLFLGVPGSSKSWATYCLAGQYRKPVIEYSIPAMEDSLVGNSAKHQRTAHRVLDAISDGKIWLIATANSLRGLPAEVISRFQVGGIWFFDAPDEEEKQGIMDLKVAKYGLKPQAYPDMANWTGRDVDNCARKAQLLGCSLEEAGQFVVPLLTSHKEDMRELREKSGGRFLSASKPGVYKFVASETNDQALEAVGISRRMR
jgi:hypothetical protein